MMKQNIDTFSKKDTRYAITPIVQSSYRTIGILCRATIVARGSEKIKLTCSDVD